MAGAPEEKAYAWTIAQVKSILKEETYIGHSVHKMCIRDRDRVIPQEWVGR